MDLKQSLENFNTLWRDAITNGDMQSIASLCTDNVVFLVQGAPLARGKMDVLALCEERAKADDFNEVQQTVTCGETGDLAYMAAMYERQTNRADGTNMTGTGKFLAVYKRQSDDTWKAHALSVFAD